MKIGFFVRNFSGGGAELVSVILANALEKMGHEITFFVLNKSGPHLPRLSRSITIVELVSRRLIFSSFALSRALIASGIDVLYSNMTHENIIAILAARKTAIKVVAVEHNNFFKEMKSRGLPTYLITRFMVSCLYPKLHALISVSKGVADEFSREFGGRLRICAIHNPIEVSACNAPADISGRYILGVGRLTHQKNFSLLINAFSLLVKKFNYNGNLVLLGEGPELNSLKLLVNALSLEGRVHFKGFVENTSSYFRGADCFVLSSLWEGFGNVIVESLLSGCKVVSTDCKYGPSEILNNGEFGTFVEDFSSESLCAAIQIELNMVRDTNVLVARGEEFNPEKVASHYLEVLK